MTQNNKITRIDWIDYAKGIGIFLVVLGHTLRSLVNASILKNSVIVSLTDQWIYAFHMPLFFVLSGLFIKRTFKKTFSDVMISRVKTIVYPYFIWSILQSIMQGISSRYTNSNSFSTLLNMWTIIYRPVMQFWFLYVLFLVIFIHQIIYRKINSSLIFLIISLIFYLTSIFEINIGGWGVLYQVRTYIIYFAIGALMGENYQFLTRLKELKNKQLILIMSLGFLTVLLGVISGITENSLVSPIIALIGIVAVLSLSIILDNWQFYDFNFVRTWGIFSLEIYVAHTIFSAVLRIVLQKGLDLTQPILYLVLVTLIGIYGPIILAKTCNYFKFNYLFTFGVR